VPEPPKSKASKPINSQVLDSWCCAEAEWDRACTHSGTRFQIMVALFNGPPLTKTVKPSMTWIEKTGDLRVMGRCVLWQMTCAPHPSTVFTIVSQLTESEGRDDTLIPSNTTCWDIFPKCLLWQYVQST